MLSIGGLQLGRNRAPVTGSTRKQPFEVSLHRSKGNAVDYWCGLQRYLWRDCGALCVADPIARVTERPNAACVLKHAGVNAIYMDLQYSLQVKCYLLRSFVGALNRFVLT